MVPSERVDDVLRVPHVIVLTIERANAAPSAAGGANADAARDTIVSIRAWTLEVVSERHRRRTAGFGRKTRDAS